jgi:hypothetical protein
MSREKVGPEITALLTVTAERLVTLTTGPREQPANPAAIKTKVKV